MRLERAADRLANLGGQASSSSASVRLSASRVSISACRSRARHLAGIARFGGAAAGFGPSIGHERPTGPNRQHREGGRTDSDSSHVDVAPRGAELGCLPILGHHRGHQPAQAIARGGQGHQEEKER